MLWGIRIRYPDTGAEADLEEAIRFTRPAVKLTPEALLRKTRRSDTALEQPWFGRNPEQWTDSGAACVDTAHLGPYLTWRIGAKPPSHDQSGKANWTTFQGTQHGSYPNRREVYSTPPQPVVSSSASRSYDGKRSRAREGISTVINESRDCARSFKTSVKDLHHLILVRQSRIYKGVRHLKDFPIESGFVRKRHRHGSDRGGVPD